MYKLINGMSVLDNENSKPPLVFVHAFPMNSEMWKPQLNHFGKDFRVVAFDVRGLGKSIAHDNLFFMENYADDLISIITELGFNNVNAVGLSMGGYIIQRAMVKKPDLFRSVTLADTKGERDTDEGLISRSDIIVKIRSGKRNEFISEFIKKLISPGNYRNSELVNFIETIISENTDFGICGAVNALATRTTTLHQLELLDIPSLILVGEEDILTPVKCSEDLSKALKNSEMHIIKNAGHMSNLENPGVFNSILEKFLKLHN